MLVKKVEVIEKGHIEEMRNCCPSVYRGKKTYYFLGIPVYTVIISADKKDIDWNEYRPSAK